MWVRVNKAGEPLYRLIHLETGNRIDLSKNVDISGGRGGDTCVLTLYINVGGPLHNGRPNIDVHDLCKGSEADCTVFFETICNNLVAQGQLTT